MEFENFSIHLPNCKNSGRQIMSNINTYTNPNTSIQELSDQDLVNCSGGSLPVGVAGPPHGNVFGGNHPITDPLGGNLPPLTFTPDEVQQAANLGLVTNTHFVLSKKGKK
jgi:hypothetical protein